MKELSEAEVNFLFAWVSNWYPTNAKPKIAILLLNRQEWKEFYEEAKAMALSKEEQYKLIDEKLKTFSGEDQAIVKQIMRLPKEQIQQILKSVMPHLGIEEHDFNYWMNEACGKCYKMTLLKKACEIFNQDIPFFFRPYVNHDFVVLISNFFSREQEIKFVKHGKVGDYQKKLFIYATIFHELIHVVEHCTGKRIFKTDSLEESTPITLKIAQKYLE